MTGVDANNMRPFPTKILTLHNCPTILPVDQFQRFNSIATINIMPSNLGSILRFFLENDLAMFWGCRSDKENLKREAILNLQESQKTMKSDSDEQQILTYTIGKILDYVIAKNDIDQVRIACAKCSYINQERNRMSLRFAKQNIAIVTSLI